MWQGIVNMTKQWMLEANWYQYYTFANTVASNCIDYRTIGLRSAHVHIIHSVRVALGYMQNEDNSIVQPRTGLFQKHLNISSG